MANLEIRQLIDQDGEALWNFRMLALETDPWSLGRFRSAKSLPELDMILLTVSVGQPAPRKLYKSLGFRPIGIEPRGLKIGNQHIDEEHWSSS